LVGVDVFDVFEDGFEGGFGVIGVIISDVIDELPVAAEDGFPLPEELLGGGVGGEFYESGIGVHHGGFGLDLEFGVELVGTFGDDEVVFFETMFDDEEFASASAEGDFSAFEGGVFFAGEFEVNDGAFASAEDGGGRDEEGIF